MKPLFACLSPLAGKQLIRECPPQMLNSTRAVLTMCQPLLRLLKRERKSCPVSVIGTIFALRVTLADNLTCA